MNITCENPKHATLQVLGQCIELEDVYNSKIEHIAGVENTGTDGLSPQEMLDNIPSKLVDKIAIANLDCVEYTDFPLLPSLIKSEQNKVDKQKTL